MDEDIILSIHQDIDQSIQKINLIIVRQNNTTCYSVHFHLFQPPQPWRKSRKLNPVHLGCQG